MNGTTDGCLNGIMLARNGTEYFYRPQGKLIFHRCMSVNAGSRYLWYQVPSKAGVSGGGGLTRGCRVSGGKVTGAGISGGRISGISVSRGRISKEVRYLGVEYPGVRAYSTPLLLRLEAPASYRNAFLFSIRTHCCKTMPLL